MQNQYSGIFITCFKTSFSDYQKKKKKENFVIAVLWCSHGSTCIIKFGLFRPCVVYPIDHWVPSMLFIYFMKHAAITQFFTTVFDNSFLTYFSK